MGDEETLVRRTAFRIPPYNQARDQVVLLGTAHLTITQENIHQALVIYSIFKAPGQDMVEWSVANKVCYRLRSFSCTPGGQKRNWRQHCL